MYYQFVMFVRRYFFLEFSKQVQCLMMVDFSKALTTQELSVIIKNEIPLLEYDDASLEVISADHEWTTGQLPEKCLFAFLGDVVHDYANQHGAEVVETIVTVSRDIKVYVLDSYGEKICLVQSPTGSASPIQVMNILVSRGCRKDAQL